jgi:pyruvate kinase
MIETMIQEEDPLRVVNGLFDAIQEYALEPTDAQVPVFYKGSDFIIRDYIIYNAYRICSELEIKAIVCYTYNGYTTARLAALHPRVPIIAFTSVDETYRYINTLW